MLATLKGHLNVVKILVNRGASLTATNYDGMNALKYAIMEGHFDIVKYFIENTDCINYLKENKDIVNYTVKESIRKYLKDKI